MKNILILFIISAVLIAPVTCSAGENPKILIKTEFGDITVEIFLEKAPITASNFLKYVDENRFSGASFYRTVTMDNQPNNEIKIEVIQGGIRFSQEREGLPSIEHEITKKTGILHKDGVISMARSAPGTASSEFFICIGDQPELDFGGKRNPDGQGFAAFGKVISGMDVVRKIQIQPVDEQMLDPRIQIHNIIRIK
jgi:peptidyl-prolyl cis-trans isomerase A (cyclophilin A)